MQLLSPKLACQRLGIGRTTLWRLERAGAFPRSITITRGANGCGGRKAFVTAEVEAWLSAKVAERDAGDSL